MYARDLSRVTLAILLTALPAAAQITITQGSFQGPGFSYSSHYTDVPVDVAVGQSGANRTWTIPEYAWAGATAISFLEPSATPYGGSFPTANRCMFDDVPGGTEGDVYLYERLTASALHVLGMASDCTIVFATPVLRAPLPATYQTSWTSVMRFSFMPIPGFTITVVDSSTHVVDGWGTITTPFGSHACLREFHHNWNTTQFTGLPPQTTETVGYVWINGQAIDVASMMSEDDVTDPNFTIGYVTASQSGVPVEPVRGPVADRFAVGQNYPNPFNPVTLLPITLEKHAQVTMEIFDGTGRLMSREEFSLPVGAHQLPVDGSAWASGTYFARVRAGGAAQTVKMQLVK